MTDTQTALPLILADTPAKAADDALGFQPHADRLAAMLLKQQFPDASFVVGIEGEWGEGKSTFINCLKQRFEQAEEKGETPPVVVEFNPWWLENPGRFIESKRLLTDSSWLTRSTRFTNLVRQLPRDIPGQYPWDAFLQKATV